MERDKGDVLMSPIRGQIFSPSTGYLHRDSRGNFVSPERTPIHRSPQSWGSPDTGEFMKRGRPKAAMIKTLINQGSSTDSSIRCSECHRIFPREKSLTAHMRTHTGERPYACDFPNCSRAFCQSGQLKTHQRLHTGEKPFVCAVKDCNNRFTHSNRHCPSHPDFALLRDEENMPVPGMDHKSPSPVKQWMQKHFSTRNGRTPYKGRTSPNSNPIKRSLFNSPRAEADSLSYPKITFESPQNKRQLDFNSEDSTDDTPIKKGRMGVSDDAIWGALALMELSQSLC